MDRTPIDPRSRVDLFTNRLRDLCDQAGLPRFDETRYVDDEATLLFLWHEPEFCMAAPLRDASINGVTATDLRESWDRKFGGGAAGQAA